MKIAKISEHSNALTNCKLHLMNLDIQIMPVFIFDNQEENIIWTQVLIFIWKVCTIIDGLSILGSNILWFLQDSGFPWAKLNLRNEQVLGKIQAPIHFGYFRIGKGLTWTIVIFPRVITFSQLQWAVGTTLINERYQLLSQDL